MTDITEFQNLPAWNNVLDDFSEETFSHKAGEALSYITASFTNGLAPIELLVRYNRNYDKMVIFDLDTFDVQTFSDKNKVNTFIDGLMNDNTRVTKVVYERYNKVMDENVKAIDVEKYKPFDAFRTFIIFDYLRHILDSVYNRTYQQLAFLTYNLRFDPETNQFWVTINANLLHEDTLKYSMPSIDLTFGYDNNDDNTIVINDGHSTQTLPSYQLGQTVKRLVSNADLNETINLKNSLYVNDKVLADMMEQNRRKRVQLALFWIFKLHIRAVGFNATVTRSDDGKNIKIVFNSQKELLFIISHQENTLRIRDVYNDKNLIEINTASSYSLSSITSALNDTMHTLLNRAEDNHLQRLTDKMILNMSNDPDSSEVVNLTDTQLAILQHTLKINRKNIGLTNVIIFGNSLLIMVNGMPDMQLSLKTYKGSSRPLEISFPSQKASRVNSYDGVIRIIKNTLLKEKNVEIERKARVDAIKARDNQFTIKSLRTDDTVTFDSLTLSKFLDETQFSLEEVILYTTDEIVDCAKSFIDRNL